MNIFFNKIYALYYYLRYNDRLGVKLPKLYQAELSDYLVGFDLYATRYGYKPGQKSIPRWLKSVIDAQVVCSIKNSSLPEGESLWTK